MSGHVDPAASKPHTYSGKFEGWRNSHEPCLHCGQPKESDAHRPSYADEPQEMTDVLGPRVSKVFRDRRAPKGNGTQGQPGLTSL